MMSVWHRHQADFHAQAWRTEVNDRIEEQEARLESRDAVMGLVPEILERLGPETITPEHQGTVRGYVKQLHVATGKPYPAIYDDIRRAFGPVRYQDLQEADWDQIEAWFLTQIRRAKQ